MCTPPGVSTCITGPQRSCVGGTVSPKPQQMGMNLLLMDNLFPSHQHWLPAHSISRHSRWVLGAALATGTICWVPSAAPCPSLLPPVSLPVLAEPREQDQDQAGCGSQGSAHLWFCTGGGGLSPGYHRCQRGAQGGGGCLGITRSIADPCACGYPPMARVWGCRGPPPRRSCSGRRVVLHGHLPKASHFATPSRLSLLTLPDRNKLQHPPYVCCFCCLRSLVTIYFQSLCWSPVAMGLW